MAGPAMIEGGGLGVVKPTDIGPSVKQAKNGVIDILVENEHQAAEMAKKCLLYFQGQLVAPQKHSYADQQLLNQVLPEDRRFVYDVKDIINGKSGIIDALNPGSVIIDHTTTSAELAKEMNELLSSKECFFVDAPISGGQLGAESGTLSVMAGGDRKVYEACNKIFKSYSKSHKYMGPSGSGQLTKMVNQICIAGLIQALAEGMHFSRRAGLNTTDVMDVITKGAAQSWQMENRWETMLNDEYDFGFAVDLMRKDLDIVLKQAKKMDTELEVTNLVNNFYKEIQKSGGGRWDTSSLLKRIQQK